MNYIIASIRILHNLTITSKTVMEFFRAVANNPGRNCNLDFNINDLDKTHRKVTLSF